MYPWSADAPNPSLLANRAKSAPCSGGLVMNQKQNIRRHWRNALIPATLFGLFTLVMSLALAVPAIS